MKSQTRLKDLWKFKFFWDNAENAKNDANILKHIFWIFIIFRYFWIFQKFYQKLGSSRCPLFTMLTKQNSSMFWIVSFVKKRKRKWSHSGLFSRATCPHMLTVVYFHRRPIHICSQWSIFTGDLPTCSYWSIFTGNLPTHAHRGLLSGATSPHTHTGLFSGVTSPHTHTGLFSGATRPSGKRKSGLIIMGDLPRWKNGLIVMGDLPR